MNKKTIVTALVAIVVVVLAVFLITKSIGAKTYAHSTGAYSFKYPSKVSVVENEGASIIIASSTSKLPLAVFSVVYEPGIFEKIKTSPGVTMSEFAVGEYTGYRFSASSSDAQSGEVVYMIPADADKSTLIAASLSPLQQDLALFSQADFSALLRTIKINKDKITPVAKKMSVLIKSKSKEVSIKSAITNIHTGAGVYKEEIGNFANLCTPTSAFKYSKELNLLYNGIVGEVGKDNFSCMANKEAFAISAKLESGEVFCVDSTGLVATGTVFVKGYSCK